MDEKQRVVAVISGNYPIEGRGVAVAGLTTRHVALLAAPSAQQAVFLPTAAVGGSTQAVKRSGDMAALSKAA
jgi:hypothetical protein